MTVECWACGAPVDPAPVDPAGYARCGNCGLRFYSAGEAPRDAYAEDYFVAYKGGNYYDTEPVRRHESRVRLDMVEREAKGRGELLEVGSAAGFFLDEARKRGWRVTGIEASADAAAFARERLGLELRVGFAEEVALEARHFDAACLWHTVEHVPRPQGLLATLREALRPGAPLLIEVPNGNSVLANREGPRWPPLEPDVHVAQWTPASLVAVLRRAGFVEPRAVTVPFLTYVPGALARAPRRVNLALRQRRWLRDPHPAGHELLRAVAHAPN
jgi:SAM-dependent methyltransferase